MFYDQDNEKYTCPVTGAHFRKEDLCQRLDRIRILRRDQESNQVHKDNLIALPKNSSDSKTNSSPQSSEPKSSPSENFIEDTIDERDFVIDVGNRLDTAAAEQALKDVRNKK